MAAAEKSKYCLAFSSGSAATSAVIHLLSRGQDDKFKIICVDDVYGGTQRYFRKIVYPTMGIDVEFVDFSDLSLLQKKLIEDEGGKKTKLLWLETPTNPTLKVILMFDP